MLYNILGIPDVAPAVWRNVPKAEGDSPKRVYRVIRRGRGGYGTEYDKYSN